MLKRTSVFPIILSLVFLCVSASPQAPKPDSELLGRLKALPGVAEVKAARFDEKQFKEAYEIMIDQPLDHRNSQGEKFRQRFFVSHIDFAKPVLLETAGYAAGRSGGGELTRILAGNQVTVEHRFFGRSVPSPVKWEYLTIKQAADDLHAIVAALRGQPGRALLPVPDEPSSSSRSESSRFQSGNRLASQAWNS